MKWLLKFNELNQFINVAYDKVWVSTPRKFKLHAGSQLAPKLNVMTKSCRYVRVWKWN